MRTLTPTRNSGLSREGNRTERHQSHMTGMLVEGVGIVCICFCAFAAPVDCQKGDCENETPSISLQFILTLPLFI